MDTSKRRKVTFVVTHAAALALALAAILLFVVAVFVPKLILHADTYIVQSTSMQPTLNPGDLVIADPAYKVEELRKGDVVTYLSSSLNDPFGSIMIVHRIVSLEHNEDRTIYKFVTKGDSNLNSDMPIGELDITGHVIYSVPFVGAVIDSPYSHLILVLLAILLFIVVVGYLRQRRKLKNDYVR